ncbi:hypothetical protein T265_08829 [Opisthorchis viverrini]|uniref:Uncharacterized protein n=1 Tax=Opisthorchis viverrini TaxID=6198 RepID=A0A074ZCE0_OPIVI|nr:hypothetical protein T265_08829 [Opisthorchis viverrini]KER23257.1 hypothetical protein T265_08829 [Opisthorchis viverrini]
MTFKELYSTGNLFSYRISCSVVVGLFTRTSSPSRNSPGCRPSEPGLISYAGFRLHSGPLSTNRVLLAHWSRCYSFDYRKTGQCGTYSQALKVIAHLVISGTG